MDFRDPKNSEGQIERSARIYHRKFAYSFGASLSQEDLCQEFWLVWTKAVECFDPEKGYGFDAFLGISMRNHALKLAKVGARKAQSFSLNASSEDGLEMVDLLADESESALDRLLREERTQALLEGIDARLRRVVELMVDTPALLQAEVGAGQAKAALAREQGVMARIPQDVTLSMMMDVFGIGRGTRAAMLKELEDLMND